MYEPSFLGTNSNMTCDLEMAVPFNTRSFVAPEPVVNVSFVDVILMAVGHEQRTMAEAQ